MGGKVCNHALVRGLVCPRAGCWLQLATCRSVGRDRGVGGGADRTGPGAAGLGWARQGKVRAGLGCGTCSVVVGSLLVSGRCIVHTCLWLLCGGRRVAVSVSDYQDCKVPVDASGPGSWNINRHQPPPKDPGPAAACLGFMTRRRASQLATCVCPPTHAPATSCRGAYHASLPLQCDRSGKLSRPRIPLAVKFAHTMLERSLNKWGLLSNGSLPSILVSRTPSL